MRIVKAYNWTKEDSVEFSIYVAELVIDIFEKKYPNDKRPREAIESAKNWLKNPTEENRQAAASASCSGSAADYSASAASAYAAAASAASATYASASASATSAYASATYASSAYAYASSAYASATYAAAAYAADYSTSAASAALKGKLNQWFVEKIKTLTVWEK